MNRLPMRVAWRSAVWANLMVFGLIIAVVWVAGDGPEPLRGWTAAALDYLMPPRLVDGPALILVWVAVMATCVLIHELGHLGVALMTGTPVIHANLGIAQVVRTGRGLRLRPGGAFWTGHVLVESPARGASIAITAAGPAASVAIGLVAAVLSHALQGADPPALGTRAALVVLFVGLVGFMSVLLGITNLIPIPGSDGAHLLRLIGLPVPEAAEPAPYRVAIGEAFRDHKRPREWPEQAIRAALVESESGLVDTHLAFLFHMDRGELDDARLYLDRVLAGDPHSATLRLQAAFFHGFWERDAVAARAQIQASLRGRGRIDRSLRDLAEAAALVAEGSIEPGAAIARRALRGLDTAEEGVAFFNRPFLQDIAALGARGSWTPHLDDIAARPLHSR